MNKIDKKLVLFDTHCHLQHITDPLDSVARSSDVGVKDIMCVSVSKTCPDKIKSIIDNNHSTVNIHSSAGIHPKDVKNMTINEIDDYLSYWLTNGNIRALGETGLDDYTPTSEKELDDQEKAFDLHLSYAKKFDLPIIMHLRCDRLSNELEKRAKRVLSKYDGVKGIAHCFGATIDMANFLIAKKWMLSFAGNITYSKDLHEAIKLTPLSQLLIETDAPFLPPIPYKATHRGRNESAYIVKTFETVCSLRNVEDRHHFAAQLYLNSCRIFKLNEPLDI